MDMASETFNSAKVRDDWSTLKEQIVIKQYFEAYACTPGILGQKFVVIQEFF